MINQILSHDVSLDFLAKRPITSHVGTALFILCPSLIWILCTPARVYDVVVEVDEYGYILSEIHSCFKTGGSSNRFFVMLFVTVQYLVMAVYSWFTVRQSSYYEALNINRCYFFRLGIFMLSTVMSVYYEGLLGENGKVELMLMMQSTFTEVVGFILISGCVILPPLIFALCPILKKCFTELALKNMIVAPQSPAFVSSLQVSSSEDMSLSYSI